MAHLLLLFATLSVFSKDMLNQLQKKPVTPPTAVPGGPPPPPPPPMTPTPPPPPALETLPGIQVKPAGGRQDLLAEIAAGKKLKKTETKEPQAPAPGTTTGGVQPSAKTTGQEPARPQPTGILSAEDIQSALKSMKKRETAPTKSASLLAFEKKFNDLQLIPGKALTTLQKRRAQAILDDLKTDIERSTGTDRIQKQQLYDLMEPKFR